MMAVTSGWLGEMTESADGLYRYDLTREWITEQRCPEGVLWIMLNPSTATDTRNDPTIRRCQDFTARWGYSHMAVVNLYALRTTKPEHLNDHPDPVGPENARTIRQWIQNPTIDLVIAAWGATAGKVKVVAPLAVDLMVWTAGRHLYCLGQNADGSPKHPLYIAAKTPFDLWQPSKEGA